MNKIFLCILLFGFSDFYSQTDSSKNIEPMFKNEYLNKVLYYNENSRSHLFYFSYAYGYAPKNKTFAMGGTQYSIGLNISRIFTDKFFLGITYSFDGSISKLFRQNLSNEFVSDFNDNFNDNQLDNIEDSANASTLFGGINKEENYTIDGNGFNLFGVTISPFPDRFGGLAFSMLYGKATYIFHGYQNIIPNSNSNLQALNQKLIRMEFTCKPYFIFKKGKLAPFDYDLKNIYKLITFSLYVEKTSFDDAEFGGNSIGKFVNQPFIDEYSSDYRFGFKLGLGLY